MITTRIVRYFSARPIVDKWFNALQSKTHEEQQLKLADCIEYSLQQEEPNYSNFLTDIIHRWAIEQPKTEALWFHEIDRNECQKLTFNDIYTQSSHFANVLTGNPFNLTTGKSVLAILPNATKEQILLQLACLQSGLIFYSYDPKYITESEIRQQIRTSAIDCIITNHDYLETITKCTHNSLRPLKKGLMSHHSTSEPLPVGWHPLIHNIPNTEKVDFQNVHTQSTKRSLRHLLSENPINQYSQSIFSLRQMLIAYWLNINQSPHLIWIKDDHNKISLAPWLLGSTIFYKQSNDIQTTFQAFEKYPIDTLCTSKNDYQILNKQQLEQQNNNTRLQQLLSVEPNLDSMTKFRWHSLTNLHIQDNSTAISADLNTKSDIQSILNSYKTNSKYKHFENIYGTNQHHLQIRQV